MFELTKASELSQICANSKNNKKKLRKTQTFAVNKKIENFPWKKKKKRKIQFFLQMDTHQHTDTAIQDESVVSVVGNCEDLLWKLKAEGSYHWNFVVLLSALDS